MRMENFDYSWRHDPEVSDSVFTDMLHDNTSQVRNSWKLKELMTPKDLTLLDLYERERQLAAREAAAIRLEERGRKHEMAARETALLGRETALAMKERELRLAEREQAVHEHEVRIQDEEAKMSSAKHKLTELENDFYKKSREESLLASAKEREMRLKEEDLITKEKELSQLQSNLNEKKNEIEKLRHKLEKTEESLKLKENILEERESKLEKREKDLKEAEQKLKSEESKNEINNEVLKREYETIQLKLEEKANELKMMENSLILQERELDSKRLEIEQELEKQDIILRDTANIMAEKEKELQKLEQETLEKIDAQEQELKLWESNLQQKESRIHDLKKHLESLESEVAEREEMLAVHSQQLLQQEKQLQARAFSLNKQAETQEDHLRVILEKERIFEELKVTLEQKEQQYKMLIQCKEHEFDVREQNLQTIISDLLHLDNKKKNALYASILFKKSFPLMHEDGVTVSEAAKLLEDEISSHIPTCLSVDTSEGKPKQHNCSKRIDIHPANIPIKDRPHNICMKNTKEQEKLAVPTSKFFSKSTSQYLRNPLTDEKLKICTPVSLLTSQSFSKQDKSSQKMVIPEKFHTIPSQDSVKIDDFTLTEEQKQLLEQIKNNTLRNDISSLQSPVINYKTHRKSTQNSITIEQPNEPFYKQEINNSCRFKRSLQNNSSPEKSRGSSFPKRNSSEKHTPKASALSSSSQTQTKSVSTCSQDLWDAFDMDLNEQNTLHAATKNFHLEIVHTLVEQKGVNVDGKDPDGRTALHWAAELGHLSLVKYLGGEMGASVDEKNNIGQTALHLAASEGRLDVVQYLTEKLGADIDMQDYNGETPLHLAAGAGWLEVVKYFSSVKASMVSRISNTTEVPKIIVEEHF